MLVVLSLTLSAAPPSTQRLPTLSHSRISSVPVVPTTHCSGKASAGRLVDGACAGPGFTSMRKGDPGSAAAFWRKPTCSRYFPTAPIEYWT